MWKKNDDEQSAQNAITPSRRSLASSSATSDGAVVGESLVFRGEISGDQNLLIEGRLEGSAVLKRSTITVGQSGNIEGTLCAQTVDIRGKVKGDVDALEMIVLHETARVEGRLTAGRLVLRDGCQFKGTVEMDQDKAKRAGFSVVPDESEHSAEETI
jgi:cytoskeletal protein CcmA (bactofilin family)